MDVQWITSDHDDYRINLKAKSAIVVGLDDATMDEDYWRNSIDIFVRDIKFSGRIALLVKKTSSAGVTFRPCGVYGAMLIFESGSNDSFTRVFQRAESVVHRLPRFGTNVACASVSRVPNETDPFLSVCVQWAQSSHLHRTAHRDKWTFESFSTHGEDYIRWTIWSDHPGKSHNEFFECTIHTYGTPNLFTCDAPRVDLSLLWR